MLSSRKELKKAADIAARKRRRGIILAKNLDDRLTGSYLDGGIGAQHFDRRLTGSRFDCRVGAQYFRDGLTCTRFGDANVGRGPSNSIA